jgi:hypothetical protein
MFKLLAIKKSKIENLRKRVSNLYLFSPYIPYGLDKSYKTILLIYSFMPNFNPLKVRYRPETRLVSYFSCLFLSFIENRQKK